MIKLFRCFYPVAINVWSEFPVQKPEDDLVVESGYFLTDSELKRVAQEAFDCARRGALDISSVAYWVPHWETFEQYWQQARKGEG